MCWYLDIKITKRARIKHYDVSYFHKLTDEYQFDGDFPRYRISRYHCLCDVFKQEFDRYSLAQIFEQIAMNSQTKCIDVVKYWGESLDNAEVKKIDMLEFLNLLRVNELEEAVWYQFMDDSKFKYN